MKLSRNLDVTNTAPVETQEQLVERWLNQRNTPQTQISYNASKMDNRSQLSETLLSQYKKCNQINKEQLRRAKNDQDLIKINIASIDKSFLMHGKQDGCFDFKWDPVKFKQQVPCLGNRDFIANAAILGNFGNQRKPKTTRHFSQTPGSSLPQLKGSEQDADAMTRGSVTGDRSEYAHDWDSSIKNRVKQCTEPVQQLQKIFRKRQPRKRIVAASYIEEKYRKQRKSWVASDPLEEMRHQVEQYHLESMPISPHAQEMSPLSPKVKVIFSAQSPPEHAPSGMTTLVMDEVQSRQDRGRVKVSHGATEICPTPKPFQQQRDFAGELEKSRLVIREKLESLRKLFADQDDIERQGNRARHLKAGSQTEFDLNSHKVMYEEAYNKLKGQEGKTCKTTEVQPGKLIMDQYDRLNMDMLDLRQDELQDFLYNRIQDLKATSTFGMALERDEINKPIYKYKASTISNLISADQAIFMRTQDKLNPTYQAKVAQSKVPSASERESDLVLRPRTPGVGMNVDLQRRKAESQKSERPNKVEYANAQPRHETSISACQQHTPKIVDEDVVIQDPAPAEVELKSPKHTLPFFGAVQSSFREKGKQQVPARNRNIVANCLSQIEKIDRMYRQKEKEQRIARKSEPQAAQRRNAAQRAKVVKVGGEPGLPEVRISSSGPSKNRLQQLISVKNGMREDLREDLKTDSIAVGQARRTSQDISQEETAQFDLDMTVALSTRQIGQQEGQVDKSIEASQFSRVQDSHGENPSAYFNSAERKQEQNLHEKTIATIDPLMDLNNSITYIPERKKPSGETPEESTQNPTPTNEYITNDQLTDLILQHATVERDLDEPFPRQKQQAMSSARTVGAQLSFFSPKRFNRFPRFAVFFKRGSQEQNLYEYENTVSLNMDFYQQIQQSQRSSRARSTSPQVADEIQQLLTKLDGASNQAAFFDPFNRVLLVKGTDNSILTSGRTIKGENNTVTETLKIVHQKFLPQKNANQRFFRQNEVAMADARLYSVDEDVDEQPSFDFVDVEKMEGHIVLPEGLFPTKSEILVDGFTAMEHPPAQETMLQHSPADHKSDIHSQANPAYFELQNSNEDLNKSHDSAVRSQSDIRSGTQLNVLEVSNSNDQHPVSDTPEKIEEPAMSDDKKQGDKSVNFLVQKKAPQKKYEGPNPQYVLDGRDGNETVEHARKFIPVTTQRNPYRSRKASARREARQGKKPQTAPLKGDGLIPTIQNGPDQVFNINGPGQIEKILIYAPVASKEKKKPDSGEGERSKFEEISISMDSRGMPHLEYLRDVDTFPNSKGAPLSEQQLSLANMAKSLTKIQTDAISSDKQESMLNHYAHSSEPNPDDLLLSMKRIVETVSQSIQEKQVIKPEEIDMLRIPIEKMIQKADFLAELTESLSKRDQMTNRQLIDEIFRKQRMYTTLHNRDTYLVNTSPIFQLDKALMLKSVTGVEKKREQKAARQDAAKLPNLRRSTERRASKSPNGTNGTKSKATPRHAGTSSAFSKSQISNLTKSIIKGEGVVFKPTFTQMTESQLVDQQNPLTSMQIIMEGRRSNCDESLLRVQPPGGTVDPSQEWTYPCDLVSLTNSQDYSGQLDPTKDLHLPSTIMINKETSLGVIVTESPKNESEIQ